MRATAEIITRWFPIIALSVFSGIAGCSSDVQDQSDATGSLRKGITAGVPEVLAGEEGGEAQVSGGSSGDREPTDRPAGKDDAETDESSLVYTREYYSYGVRNKKDPFQPLLTRGGQLEGLTLNELVLTGILWGEDRSLVVLEDSQGRGFLLQVGDKIAGARLVAIREDAAVFRVVEFGVVHNVEKKLFIQEEKPI